MDFTITLVGLNHRTASVDVRERFALSDHCSPDTWILPVSSTLKESLILSTCNRVELLGIAETNSADHMLQLWAKAKNGNVDDLRQHVYMYENNAAITHIFEVASSLDSMVLGEPQILGQMKQAYRKAVDSHAAGSILNRLMHKAFNVAKRVRNETSVAANAVSISFAAVELAKRIFGNMQSHAAMLIGAGEMAELAAMHLIQAGVENMVIANRTYAHAEALARKFKGTPIPFDALENGLKTIDILISSTGSTVPIIDAELMERVLKARKNRPMFIIDIAVPRDIDPAINTLDNIYLYDIDDLKEIVQENILARKEEAEKARLIIAEEVTLFNEWLENLAAKPTIIDLLEKSQAACEVELKRAFKRLGPLTDQQKEVIINMAHAITQKLNHAPLVFLKEKGMSQAGQLHRINMVRRIFDLDEHEKF